MPKKLLLADDSVTIQKVISITFASDDYELVIVGDGDSAVAKAKESAPDIILADVAMPGKNGYEVCEAVKTDAALCNIPVMLLAGTFEPLDSEEATRVKADDSIVKPFESQELIDKVNSLLANSLPSIDTTSVESSFEVPEDDFGADAIPGIEDAEEATPDLEFLEGGIFEEATANSDATSHAPFVDLDATDEEFTSVDSSPDVLDISAATATEENGTNGDDLSLTDIGESGEAFSFEPEAESLEVEEAQADNAEQTFELDSFEPEAEQEQAGLESLTESAESENSFVSTGQSFEESAGEGEGVEATSFEVAPDSGLESVLTGSSEEVVDYGTAPEFELDSHTPEPGSAGDIEEPVAEVGTEAIPELIEEPVFDEAAPFEAVPEKSAESVSAGSSSEEPAGFVVTPEFELDSSVPEPGSVGDIEEPVEEVCAEAIPELIEEPATEVGTEAIPELIEEPALDEAEVSEELIESLDDDFNAEPVVETETEVETENEAELEPALMYEAALEELEPEEAPVVESVDPVESVTEAAVETVVEQSVEEVAAAAAADITGSVPTELVEEIVTKVAREIIEKVAWEVVPELAEELINAEIRKFKSVMMQTK